MPDFVTTLRRITDGQLAMPELVEIAEGWVSRGEAGHAAELYKTWIVHNSHDPFLFAVYYNYAVVAFLLRNFSVAKEAWQAALQINPHFFLARLGLGSALEQLGATTEAVLCWQQLIEQLEILEDTTGIDNAQMDCKEDALQRAKEALTRTEESLQHNLDQLRPIFEALHPTDPAILNNTVWKAKALSAAQTLATTVKEAPSRFFSHKTSEN